MPGVGLTARWRELWKKNESTFHMYFDKSKWLLWKCQHIIRPHNKIAMFWFCICSGTVQLQTMEKKAAWIYGECWIYTELQLMDSEINVFAVMGMCAELEKEENYVFLSYWAWTTIIFLFLSWCMCSCFMVVNDTVTTWCASNYSKVCVTALNRILQSVFACTWKCWNIPTRYNFAGSQNTIWDHKLHPDENVVIAFLQPQYCNNMHVTLLRENNISAILIQQ